MDVPIPPVVRDVFVYRDTLLVDVGGDLKRHPRAPASELKPLLEGTAPKDQVTHWYEAQLIHYGLPRSKDKNTAKLRLSQALAQGKLAVPPQISDMEAQMRKEYAANVRKAKAALTKATTGSGTSVGKGKGGKRKAEADDMPPSGKKTKITLNVDGMKVSIEQSAATTQKSQATKQPSTAAKTAKDQKTAPRKTPLKAASKSKTTSKGEAPMLQKSSSSSKVSAARKNVIPKTGESKPGQISSLKKEAKVKPEAKTKPEPKVKAEPRIKPEPKPKPDKRVKAEPEDDDSKRLECSFLNFTGVYNIHCPQVEEQIPECAGNLRLFLCVDAAEDRPTRIWGGFEFAHKSGVLRVDQDIIESDVPLKFSWRARDIETGNAAFRRVCTGELELITGGPNRQIRGELFNLFPGAVTFTGVKRSGPLWSGRAAWQYEEDWDRIPREAYGRG